MKHGEGHLGEEGVSPEERHDERTSVLVWAGAGLAIVLVVVSFAMLWLFNYLAAEEAARSPRRNPLATTYGRELPPQPRLQSAPLRDLEHLRAREDAILHGYGWMDRERGLVRIPIERAMELLAERDSGAAAQEQGRR